MKSRSLGGRGWLRHWPWLILLCVVVAGLTRLGFDADILDLLPRHLPEAKALRIHQRYFSDVRQLVVTVESRDPAVTESAAQALAGLFRRDTNLVSGVFWQPPWLEDTRQIAELAGYLWLNSEPAGFRSWASRFAPGALPAHLEHTASRLTTSLSPDELFRGTRDPFGFLELPAFKGAAMGGGNGFASEDGLFRLVFVDSAVDITGYRECRDWFGRIQQLVIEAQRSGVVPAEVRIAFTGRPAFVTEISSGMEQDMSGSAAGTLATIAALFWLIHRRIRPLLWLLFLLLVVLVGTTVLGALLLGRLNVISIGFASILVGLAEDFGIMIYQESRSHPGLDSVTLRKEVAPGIFWSALTTAAAFLVLNLSSLPGLAQMGTLIAIGILLGAAAMVWIYLPVVAKLHSNEPAAVEPVPSGAAGPGRRTAWMRGGAWGWGWTLLLGILSGLVLWKQGVRFNRSPDVLKPKRSEATEAYSRIKSRFERSREPIWVLVPAASFDELSLRLNGLEAHLSKATADGLLRAYSVPLRAWPNSNFQSENAATINGLLQRRDEFRRAALNQGYDESALNLMNQVLDFWEKGGVGRTVSWPDNAISRWLVGRFVSKTPEGWLALAVLTPTADAAALARLTAEWPSMFAEQGMMLSGWELLGGSIFRIVLRELPMTVIPIVVLVLVSLWMAFRSLRDVLLSVAALGFGGILLLASMSWLGLEWNLLNLMAIPLLLGMGVDFSIHMLLALRRHDGDSARVRRGVGHALLLAGLTTVVGFGSLSFSSNAGMSSLGQVCALGILIALLTAVYLLPGWYGFLRRLRE